MKPSFLPTSQFTVVEGQDFVTPEGVVFSSQQGTFTSTMPIGFANPSADEMPLRMPSIAPAFLPLLGSIAHLWGEYEIQLDETIEKLVASDIKYANRKWLRSPYVERAKLIASRIKDRFSKEATIVEYVDKTLSLAKVLQADRNVLLHGRTKSGFNIHKEGFEVSVRVFIQAENRKDGSSKDYTLSELSKINLKIGNIVARMQEITMENSDTIGMSQEDRATLNSFIKSFT